MSTHMNRIAVISSNAAKLCELLNDADVNDILQEFMSPEGCIEGCDTHQARVELLCAKMIQEIMTDNMKMYDTLAIYFLKRSEAYKSMYKTFMTIDSNNNVNSELLSIQEKVNKLTEELLNWRQVHGSSDCQSELNVMKKLLAKVKDAIDSEWNEKFSYDGLFPVAANAAGSYPPFDWQKENLLCKWTDLLRDEYAEDGILSLPPLVLNGEFPDRVPIVIFAERSGDEFTFHGGFHGNVPASVSPFNVQLQLTLVFTKKDNTKWSVDKQIIFTVEHETCPILILYDIPFSWLSSSTAPVATNISIRKISLGEEDPLSASKDFASVDRLYIADQKWFYCGLAPLFSKNGKFNTIDCRSLNGTEECVRVWAKFFDRNFDDFCLPSLVLPGEIAQDAAVCVHVSRKFHDLVFSAVLHPSTPYNVRARRMHFAIHFGVKKNEDSIWTEFKEATVTLKRDFSELFTFTDLPWSSLSPLVPPFMTFTILPA